MAISLSSTSSSGAINVNGVDVITSNATGEVSARVNGSTQALSSLASIGIGQTWQNVTASRALGTTYTNTTGRPIQVIFSAYNANAGGRINCFINGNIVAIIGTGTGGDYPYVIFTAIIPNGQTYAFSVIAGSFDTLKWNELR